MMESGISKKEILASKGSYTFDDLCSIMEILRGDDGCPWDREQDHVSIRNALIEETYEAVEGIDNQDSNLLKEELGDVLFQIVFHAQLEKEAGNFSMQDVVDGICEKMIYRHPHVFASDRIETSEEVLVKWDQLKSKEKSRKTATESVCSVPPSLPALMRAERVGEKAAKYGFDFADAEEARQKITEETTELYEAVDSDSAEAAMEELGDLLFSVVNYARKLGYDPERALNVSTDKFIRRFARLEQCVNAEGKDIRELSMPELDSIWEKNKEKKDQ